MARKGNINEGLILTPATDHITDRSICKLDERSFLTFFPRVNK
ncbi:unnamed protein product [Schistosoma margrebowiei]|uniref:Uncharacterized protein n=1 Tax=Schistosoma margrebowiei TaxID=48269 RepID=A0A3P7Z8D5_9TREM|nr:unnamed protein product [Schistosoma margrebowiei]